VAVAKAAEDPTTPHAPTGFTAGGEDGIAPWCAARVDGARATKGPGLIAGPVVAELARRNPIFAGPWRRIGGPTRPGRVTPGLPLFIRQEQRSVPSLRVAEGHVFGHGRRSSDTGSQPGKHP